MYKGWATQTKGNITVTVGPVREKVITFTNNRFCLLLAVKNSDTKLYINDSTDIKFHSCRKILPFSTQISYRRLKSVGIKYNYIHRNVFPVTVLYKTGEGRV